MCDEVARERRRSVPRKKKADVEVEVGEAPEELTDEETFQLVNLISSVSGPPERSSKPRIVSLYGEIDEEQCAEVAFTLLALSEMGVELEPEVEGGPTGEAIKLLISTAGGSASDMLAVYDAMRMVKLACPVETIGLGKVMSAGVLLLAAGTRGKRRIGRNCRVMIHGVAAGAGGAGAGRRLFAIRLAQPPKTLSSWFSRSCFTLQKLQFTTSFRVDCSRS